MNGEQWRRRGVTHWHLRKEEWATLDPQRFDNDRARQAMLDAHAVAYSPREALDWLIKQQRAALERATDSASAARTAGLVTEADWRLLEEISFSSLTHGKFSGRGTTVSPGRSVDLMAYPMTADMCARHRP